MAHANWGVVVRSLSTGEVLYERNPDKLMVPASNMKIVTLAAAARVIGWDARFTTTLETAAPIDGETLRGDLYVRGGGDPTINTRNGRGAAVFADWAAALQAAGIRRIDGRIVGDDNLFDDEGLGAGWAWDYLEADYAAPVGALQYNEDVAALTVLPGRAPGDPAVVSIAAGSGLTLDNKALTAAAGTPETIQYRRRLERASGGSHGNGPASASRAVAGKRGCPHGGAKCRRRQPDGLLRAVAEGCARRREASPSAATRSTSTICRHRRSATAAQSKRVLARTESQPLRDIAAVMMKVSQNLYAETLFKAAGLAAKGAGTAQAGRTAVLETLREWKLDERALVMLDGSGLSRYDYVTANLHRVDLLERLHTDPQPPRRLHGDPGHRRQGRNGDEPHEADAR